VEPTPVVKVDHAAGAGVLDARSEAGAVVDDRSDRGEADLRLASKDDLGDQGRPDDVRAPLTKHPDLGRRLEARPFGAQEDAAVLKPLEEPLPTRQQGRSDFATKRLGHVHPDPDVVGIEEGLRPRVGEVDEVVGHHDRARRQGRVGRADGVLRDHPLDP